MSTLREKLTEVLEMALEKKSRLTRSIVIKLPVMSDSGNGQKRGMVRRSKDSKRDLGSLRHGQSLIAFPIESKKTFQ